MENDPQGRRNMQKDTESFILGFRENRLLFSGALGVSLIAFTGLLQFSWQELDTALTFSLFCFTGSIPVNAMCIYLTSFAIDRTTNLRLNKSFAILATIGLVAAFAGITSLFWYFHRSVGVLFLVVSVLVIGFALLERSKHTRA